MKVFTRVFGSRESRPALALLLGIVLILLGAWMIYSARHMHSFPPVGMNLVYYDWDMNGLLIGIALALVGTSIASASETYRLATRKKKGLGGRPLTSMKVYSWTFGSREVGPTLALVIGIVLVVLGGAMIYSARHQHYQMALGYEGRPYWVWDMNYLLIGMALSLVGTAMASASETYRLVTKRKKGV
jgi:uncharacterized membrane protein